MRSSVVARRASSSRVMTGRANSSPATSASGVPRHRASRAPQRARRAGRIAGPQRVTPDRGEAVEPLHVHRLARDVEHVATRLCRDRVRAERPTQPRDGDLQCVAAWAPRRPRRRRATDPQARCDRVRARGRRATRRGRSPPTSIGSPASSITSSGPSKRTSTHSRLRPTPQQSASVCGREGVNPTCEQRMSTSLSVRWIAWLPLSSSSIRVARGRGSRAGG